MKNVILFVIAVFIWSCKKEPTPSVTALQKPNDTIQKYWKDGIYINTSTINGTDDYIEIAGSFTKFSNPYWVNTSANSDTAISVNEPFFDSAINDTVYNFEQEYYSPRGKVGHSMSGFRFSADFDTIKYWANTVSSGGTIYKYNYVKQ